MRLQLGRPLLGVVQAQRPGEHHVRRQRRALGAHRPHVEMVHRLHAVLRTEGGHAPSATSISGGTASSSTRVVSRSSRQAAITMSTAMNSDAIGVEPLGAERRATPTAGDDDRDRTERVHHEVPERGAHVEVAVRAARQHCGAADVHDEPADADHEHRAGVHVLRVCRAGGSPSITMPIAPASSNTPLACAASTSARSKPKVWRSVGGRCASASAPNARPSASTSEVRWNGVGDEGEAVEQQAADQLDDEKHRVRRERDQQRAAAGANGGVDDDKSTTRAGSSTRPGVRPGPLPARTAHRRRRASSRRRAASPWA